MADPKQPNSGQEDSHTQPLARSNCCGAKPKINKNAFPRRSKFANKLASADTRTSLQNNTDAVQEQSQHSDLELDDDSAISSCSDITSLRSMSFEWDSLVDEMPNLDLQPENQNSTQQGSEPFTVNPEQTHSEQPIFTVPKITSPTRSVQVKCRNSKNAVFFLKQNETLFHKRGVGDSSDVGMDGLQSDVMPTDTNNTTLETYQTSLGTISSLRPGKGGRFDFVILHTDADLEAVHGFRDHLLSDLEIQDLTVDLFSNIDAGKSDCASLSTLHDTYRYILTYVTDNLESDRYCRFLQEIIITFGLREANGKEDRVVPVFTANNGCSILELSVIKGLQYFRFHSEKRVMRKMYLDCVKRLVQTGRTRFP